MRWRGLETKCTEGWREGSQCTRETKTKHGNYKNGVGGNGSLPLSFSIMGSSNAPFLGAICEAHLPRSAQLPGAPPASSSLSLNVGRAHTLSVSSLGYTKSLGQKTARLAKISSPGDRKLCGINAVIGLEEIGPHPQSLGHRLPMGPGAAVGDMGTRGSRVPRPGQHNATWRHPLGTISSRAREMPNPGGSGQE